MKQDVYYDLCCILQYPFSERCRKMFEAVCPDVEEASVLAALREPSSIAQIAKKLDISVENVNKHIQSLLRKGAIAWKCKKGDEDLYVFGPYAMTQSVEEFTDGIIYAIAMLNYDYETDTLTDPEKQAIIDTCTEFVEKDWYRFQRPDELMRGRQMYMVGYKPTITPGVLAMEKSGITEDDLPEGQKKWSYAWRVKQTKSINVSACPCRFRKGVRKEFPLYTCAFFDNGNDENNSHWLNMQNEMGLRKDVSPEEYLEIARKGEKLGMIHNGGACLCEPETCNIMHPLKLYGTPQEGYHRSPFRSVPNDKAKGDCIACGTCVSKCNFDAIKIVNGKAVVNQDLCYGCGACVAVCDRDQHKLIMLLIAQG